MWVSQTFSKHKNFWIASIYLPRFHFFRSWEASQLFFEIQLVLNPIQNYSHPAFQNFSGDTLLWLLKQPFLCRFVQLVELFRTTCGIFLCNLWNFFCNLWNFFVQLVEFLCNFVELFCTTCGMLLPLCCSSPAAPVPLLFLLPPTCTPGPSQPSQVPQLYCIPIYTNVIVYQCIPK